MLRLAITAENRVRHVRLPPDSTLSIGSAPDNDVVIGAPGVSRHHASIKRVGQGVSIADRGSKNGTIVGGRAVTDAVLIPGQTVRLGAAHLELHEVSTSDVELGLRLSDSSGAVSVGDATSRTMSAAGESDSGAAAALRWARLAEACDRGELADLVDALLSRARDVLAARSLILFLPAGKDITVIAIAGALPNDRDVETLLAGGGKEWMVTGSKTLLGVSPSTDFHRGWRREFLDYVHDKLSATLGSPLAAPVKRSRERVVPQSRMIVGPSPESRRVLDELTSVAGSGVDVLIVGETGVGKELVARMIHEAGPTASGPFLAINCTAIARELLEAELFGIGRGVATGVESRPGLFVAADGGTILLDEIGEMPLSLQPKLLRVLQEREVLPVGATRPRRIALRVISSTNCDLYDMVTRGAFRADLYYRLRSAEIRVPPLRNRADDLPALARAFARSAAKSAQKRIAGFSRRALAQLVAYPWPGNIRELRSAIEAAVRRCKNGGVIRAEHLEPLLPGKGARPAQEPLQDMIADAERTAIVDALLTVGGNKTKAALLLGVTRAGLYLKMKRHGLH